MADHVVQQLLAATVARLTGLATTGSRVYLDRPEEHALQASELPALRIYDDGEECELADTGTESVRRTVSVRIEAVVKTVTAPGAQQRQIRQEVEIALATPLTVAGRSVRLVYQGADAAQPSAAADQPISVQAMRFSAEMYSALAAPDTLDGS